MLSNNAATTAGKGEFAPPGASQKKGAISEFPTKGYPPNLRVVAVRTLDAPTKTKNLTKKPPLINRLSSPSIQKAGVRAWMRGKQYWKAP
jgi:hypothetical protein